MCLFIKKQSLLSLSAVSSNFDNNDASIRCGTPYILAELSTHTIIGPRREALSERSRREGLLISDL